MNEEITMQDTKMEEDTVGPTAVGLLGPHAAAPERQVSDQADEQSGENAQVRARPGAVAPAQGTE